MAGDPIMLLIPINIKVPTILQTTKEYEEFLIKWVIQKDISRDKGFSQIPFVTQLSSSSRDFTIVSVSASLGSSSRAHFIRK